MKLIKELTSLNESVMPKFIVIHSAGSHPHGAEAILDKFGFKFQGTAYDFDLTEDDLDGYGADEFSIWAPTKPGASAVKAAIVSGDDVVPMGD